MHRYVKKGTNIENKTLLMFLVVMTSIFLNHSNKDFGINVSLSDIFIILSMLLLIIKGKLVLPSYYTMFFMILSISLMIISIVWLGCQNLTGFLSFFDIKPIPSVFSGIIRVS